MILIRRTAANQDNYGIMLGRSVFVPRMLLTRLNKDVSNAILQWNGHKANENVRNRQWFHNVNLTSSTIQPLKAVSALWTRPSITDKFVNPATFPSTGVIPRKNVSSVLSTNSLTPSTGSARIVLNLSQSWLTMCVKPAHQALNSIVLPTNAKTFNVSETLSTHIKKMTVSAKTPRNHFITQGSVFHACHRTDGT